MMRNVAHQERNPVDEHCRLILSRFGSSLMCVKSRLKRGGDGEKYQRRM